MVSIDLVILRSFKLEKNFFQNEVNSLLTLFIGEHAQLGPIARDGLAIALPLDRVGVEAGTLKSRWFLSILDKGLFRRPYELGSTCSCVYCG